MASKPVKVKELGIKKLALWHTPTFRPIMTHDELEPLMAAAGFVLLPSPEVQKQHAAFVWREYASQFEAAAAAAAAAAGRWRGKGSRRHTAAVPRPRLPDFRIDGLHLKTYKAFLLALEFYLDPTLVPDLFHVRTMPLTREQDRVFGKVYRRMKDCEMAGDEGILVYRDGTLDHITRIQFGGDEIDDDSSSSNAASVISGSADNSMNVDEVNLSRFVRLEDLFPAGGLSSCSDSRSQAKP